MYYLIYKITNVLNNKIYIGKHKTSDINDDYMGSGKILHRAIKRYGLNNFKKEILFECSTEEEMNRKEAEIVNDDFISRLDTYNIKLGGQGGFDYVNSNSKLQSLKSKNYWNTLSDKSNHPILMGYKKWKNNLSNEEISNFNLNISNKLKKYYKTHNNPWKGRKHTIEEKNKIGLALSRYVGKLNYNYGKCWIYNDTIMKNYKIDKNNLDEWLKNNWKLGRKMKYSYYINKK